jgi:multiple sugar transport system substrate-binding protein
MFRSSQHVSRRTLLKMMGSAVAATALSACTPVAAPGDTTQGGEASASQAATGIVFGSYTWAEFTPMLDSVVAAFEEAHPEISVEKQFAGWGDYWQKNQTQLAAGTPPDVGIMSIAYIGQYGTRGILLNLDPYIEANQIDMSKYWPIAEYSWQMESGARQVGTGPHLAFSIALANESCFVYNKTMFDKAGVAVPAEDWDWTDVLEAAQQLTNDTGDPESTEWGIASLEPRDRIWPRIWDHGGSVLDDEYTTCLLAEPEAMQALQWVHDTIWVHKVAPQTLPTHAVNPFLTGRIAMFGCGSWVPSSFKDAEFDWQVANWPRSEIDGKRNVQANADGFSAFQASKNPDSAWTFLNFLVGPDQPGATMWAGMFSSIPGVKELAYSDTYLSQPGLPSTYKTVVDDLENGISKHTGVGWSEWVDAQEQALGGAWSGELPLADAVQKAVTDINAILSEI